jgi:hypothetical protein
VPFCGRVSSPPHSLISFSNHQATVTSGMARAAPNVVGAVRARHAPSSLANPHLHTRRAYAGVGKYSNLTIGKYNATSAVRTCSLCPGGRFQKRTGQGSCDRCEEGELSVSDRSDCGSCAPGSFRVPCLWTPCLWTSCLWRVRHHIPTNRITLTSSFLCHRRRCHRAQEHMRTSISRANFAREARMLRQHKLARASTAHRASSREGPMAPQHARRAVSVGLRERESRSTPSTGR